MRYASIFVFRGPSSRGGVSSDGGASGSQGDAARYASALHNHEG